MCVSIRRKKAGTDKTLVSGHRGPLGAIKNLRTLGPGGAGPAWGALFGSGSRHDQFCLFVEFGQLITVLQGLPGRCRRIARCVRPAKSKRRSPTALDCRTRSDRAFHSPMVGSWLSVIQKRSGAWFAWGPRCAAQIAGPRIQPGIISARAAETR
jgi:hypothetical protein